MYMFTGMKKIQEFISHEENLFELCNQNFEIAQSLKSTFVNFFKLDTKVFRILLNNLILNNFNHSINIKKKGKYR